MKASYSTSNRNSSIDYSDGNWHCISTNISSSIRHRKTGRRNEISISKRNWRLTYLKRNYTSSCSRRTKLLLKPKSDHWRTIYWYSNIILWINSNWK